MNASSPTYNRGDTTRMFREARGWSQRQLARRVGISHGYLSDLETGRKPLHFTMVLRIAEAIFPPHEHARAAFRHGLEQGRAEGRGLVPAGSFIT